MSVNEGIKRSGALILASASPRRRELLCAAGIEAEVFVTDADEGSIIFDPSYPERYVRDIALLKNRAAADMLRKSGRDLSGAVILSADTTVIIPGEKEPLGKPKGYGGAVKMLSSLSGTSHYVITGVVLLDCTSGVERIFAESTEVRFRELSPSEIDEYIRVSPPYDKAGAYGIQDEACGFVEAIVGSYSNVVGLPVERVLEELGRI